MNQTEALIALQKHPAYVSGTVISSIRKRGDRWVATVLEPKVAGENPFADEGEKEEKSDSPPKEESPEEEIIEDELGGGPDSPSPEGLPGEDGGDEAEGDKGSTDDKILHVLEQILHAVGGGGLGGPDALGPGPDGPPAPPPPGAAKGAPPKGPAPRPMKPGDTPPGGTPIGAPAFASTRESIVPPQGTPVPPGQAGPTGVAACPQCGGPVPCPAHGTGDLGAQVASYAARAATITLSTDGNSIKQAVAEARPAVEAQGYQVKQAKRGDDGRIHILASRR